MATEAIHKYLKSQNRPYSVNDIVQNLNKQFGKTVVQKSLEQLVEDGKVMEKAYGKQKVYCIVQEKDSDPAKSKQEMEEMDRKITKLQESFNTAQSQLKSAETELKTVESSLTTEEAVAKQEKLIKSVEELRKKLKGLQQNSGKIAPEAKQKIQAAYEVNMKEYKKRKRISMDILNTILETYPKKKKDLFEAIGIETDEDVGCTLLK